MSYAMRGLPLAVVAIVAVSCSKEDGNNDVRPTNNDDNNTNGLTNNDPDTGGGDTGTDDVGGDMNTSDMGTPDAEPDMAMEPFSADCTYTVWATGDATMDYNALQTALLDVQTGEIVCISDGAYAFDQELSLTTDGVEIRGQSRDGTILDFSAQTSGGNGILATGNDVTFASFTVQDTPGDAIRVTGADGVTFRDLNVTWSAGSDTDNGAYGLYPVQCQNVLIEDSVVSYASDAGVYVGQSMNVIVRNTEAFGNVAGIEIENTTGADVFDNHSHDNTGGLLIFDLPGPPVQGGNSNKIHNNIIENNNTPNFAEAGNIVGLVPAGTGILVLSSDLNEIHENTITNNSSLGVAIVSFQTTGQAFDFNPDFDPFAEGNWVHNNVLEGNGFNPVGFAVLIATDGGVTELEALAWDGIVDPDKDNTDGALTNCFSDNVDENGDPATFRNVDGPSFDNQNTDISGNVCEHTPLPATVLP